MLYPENNLTWLLRRQRDFILLVSSFVLTVAIPEWLVGQSEDRQWGRERIVIRSVHVEKEDAGFREVSKTGVTRKDFDALTSVGFARTAVAIRSQQTRARFLENEADVMVLGTSTPDIVDAAFAKIVVGRNFREREFVEVESVCLIDSEIAEKLFQDANPIGRNIKMESDVFTVVGVVDYDHESQGLPVVIMPIRTMRSRWGDQVTRRDAGSFSVRHYELSEIWIPGPSTETKLRLAANVMELAHDSDEDYVVEVVER